MRFSTCMSSAVLALALIASVPGWAADIGASSWTESDAGNNQTPPSGWPAAVMRPNEVAPAARAMMGALKRWHNRANPTKTSTGSANVQVLTYDVASTAYVSGDSYRFIAGFTNTGATTLNIDGLGAKAVQINGVALSGGEWSAGSAVEVYYNGTNFQMLGKGPAIGQHWNIRQIGGITSMQGLLTTDTDWEVFGDAGIALATEGNQNGIVGSVINNLAPSSVSFPSGVTGHGKVDVGSNGNVAFGVYGQCDLHAPGICVTEIDANNWSGEPDPTLPPNQTLGTTTNVAIPLHLGCGGTFKCPIMLSLNVNGAAPQQSVIGLYTWPAAISGTAILVDANGVDSPTNSAILRNSGAGTHLVLQTMGAPAVPNNQVLRVLDSLGNPHLEMTQAGSIRMMSRVAPPTPGTSGSFEIYVDVADSTLKAKSYTGTVTTLALP